MVLFKLYFRVLTYLYDVYIIRIQIDDDIHAPLYLMAFETYLTVFNPIVSVLRCIGIHDRYVLF